MRSNTLKKYIKMIAEGSAFTNLDPNETLRASYMSKKGFGVARTKSDTDQYNVLLLNEINKKLENFDYQKISKFYDTSNSNITDEGSFFDFFSIIKKKIIGNNILNKKFIKRKDPNLQHIFIPETEILTTNNYLNINIDKGEIILDKRNYAKREEDILNELEYFLSALMRVYNFYIHDVEFPKSNNSTRYFDSNNFISAHDKKTLYDDEINAKKRENFAKFLLNIAGPNMFISFINPYEKDSSGADIVPNLSINPVAKFATPHGIYAYPFDKHNALNYIFLGAPTHAKFAKLRPYFHLIRIDIKHPNVLTVTEGGKSEPKSSWDPTPQAQSNWGHSKTYSEQDYNNDFNELVRISNILFNFPLSKNFSGEIFNFDKSFYNSKYDQVKSKKIDFINHKEHYDNAKFDLIEFMKEIALSINDTELYNKLSFSLKPTDGRPFLSHSSARASSLMRELLADIDKHCNLTSTLSAIYDLQKQENEPKKHGFQFKTPEAIKEKMNLDFQNALEKFKNINPLSLRQISNAFRKICTDNPRFENEFNKKYQILSDRLKQKAQNEFELEPDQLEQNPYMTPDDVLNSAYQYRAGSDPINISTKKGNEDKIQKLIQNVVKIHTELKNIQDRGVRIWKAAFFISKVFSYNDQNKNFNVDTEIKNNATVSKNELRSELFSLLLNSIGIKCVIDRGSGFVHGNEPSQMHIVTFGENDSFYEYIGTFDNIFELDFDPNLPSNMQPIKEQERRQLIKKILNIKSKWLDQGQGVMFRNLPEKDFTRQPDEPGYDEDDQYLEYILKYNKPAVDYTFSRFPGEVNSSPVVRDINKGQSDTSAVMSKNPLRNPNIARKFSEALAEIYEKIYGMNSALKKDEWYQNIVDKINDNYVNDTKARDEEMLVDQNGNMPLDYETQPQQKGVFHFRNNSLEENVSREILNTLKYKKLKLLY